MSLKTRTQIEVEAEIADDELVRRCVEQRAPEAFEMLMSRYHGRIYAVVTRLVGDADRARDLTQETFLKAWRAIDRFEGSAAFYTWLYRIARNAVTSDYRKSAVRPRVTVSLDHGPAGREEGESLDVEAASGDPVEETLSRERRDAIVAAIDSLIPDFREIIVLRDVEKYAYEDIAEMLEIPVGTVRSRLHRARMELKAKLVDILD